MTNSERATAIRGQIATQIKQDALRAAREKPSHAQGIADLAVKRVADLDVLSDDSILAKYGAI